MHFGFNTQFKTRIINNISNLNTFQWSRLRNSLNVPNLNPAQNIYSIALILLAAYTGPSNTKCNTLSAPMSTLCWKLNPNYLKLEHNQQHLKNNQTKHIVPFHKKKNNWWSHSEFYRTKLWRDNHVNWQSNRKSTQNVHSVALCVIASSVAYHHPLLAPHAFDEIV